MAPLYNASPLISSEESAADEVARKLTCEVADRTLKLINEVLEIYEQGAKRKKERKSRLARLGAFIAQYARHIITFLLWLGLLAAAISFGVKHSIRGNQCENFLTYCPDVFDGLESEGVTLTPPPPPVIAPGPTGTDSAPDEPQGPTERTLDRCNDIYANHRSARDFIQFQAHLRSKYGQENSLWQLPCHQAVPEMRMAETFWGWMPMWRWLLFFALFHPLHVTAHSVTMAIAAVGAFFLSGNAVFILFGLHWQVADVLRASAWLGLWFALSADARKWAIRSDAWNQEWQAWREDRTPLPVGTEVWSGWFLSVHNVVWRILLTILIYEALGLIRELIGKWLSLQFHHKNHFERMQKALVEEYVVSELSKPHQVHKTMEVTAGGKTVVLKGSACAHWAALKYVTNLATDQDGVLDQLADKDDHKVSRLKDKAAATAQRLAAMLSQHGNLALLGQSQHAGDSSVGVDGSKKPPSMAARLASARPPRAPSGWSGRANGYVPVPATEGRSSSEAQATQAAPAPAAQGASSSTAAQPRRSPGQMTRPILRPSPTMDDGSEAPINLPVPVITNSVFDSALAGGPNTQPASAATSAHGSGREVEGGEAAAGSGTRRVTGEKKTGAGGMGTLEGEGPSFMEEAAEVDVQPAAAAGMEGVASQALSTAVTVTPENILEAVSHEAVPSHGKRAWDKLRVHVRAEQAFTGLIGTVSREKRVKPSSKKLEVDEKQAADALAVVMSGNAGLSENKNKEGKRAEAIASKLAAANTKPKTHGHSAVNQVQNYLLNNSYMKVFSLDDDDGGGDTTELTNRNAARQLAYYLFWNLRSGGSSGLALTADDVITISKAMGLKDEKAAWDLFDTNGDSSVTMDEVMHGVEKVYNQRKFLARTLLDNQSVVQQVETCVWVFLFIILIFIVIGIFRRDAVASTWTAMSAGLISVTFIIGNSIRQVFENSLFLLFMHPFDVGDVINFEGDRYTVRSISLQAVNLDRVDGASVIVSTSELRSARLHNITRSGLMWEGIIMSVDIETSVDALELVAAEIEANIKMHPTWYGGDYRIWLSHGVSSHKLTMPTYYNFSDNGTDLINSGLARTHMIAAIARGLSAANVHYTLPPVRGGGRDPMMEVTALRGVEDEASAGAREREGSAGNSGDTAMMAAAAAMGNIALMT